MTVLEAALLGFAGVFAAISLAWLIQWRTGNAGIVDAIWSWSLGGLGLLDAALGSAPPATRLVLALMAGLWGLRLGTHVFHRNHGKPEDRRYHEFRERWGEKANRNFFFFFHFQTVFALLLSSTFLVAAFNPTPLPPGLLLLALLIWLAAVIGESVADAQMERFRADPGKRGQVCREGLWYYSRHPNYFFECLHWLAYLPLAYGAPGWWGALASPLIMAWLLLRLSGVPILERHLLKTRRGYADYMRKTSVLIPWPPKKAGRRL